MCTEVKYVNKQANTVHATDLQQLYFWIFLKNILSNLIMHPVVHVYSWFCSRNKHLEAMFYSDFITIMGVIIIII